MKTRQERLKEFWNSPAAVALPSDFCKWLECSEFFYAPASTKYHGNYEGGLFDHSFMVMNTLADLTRHNNLKWQRDGSPFIVGLLHDLCKIDSYEPVYDPTRPDDAPTFKYNTDTLLTGHGDKSVMLISEHMQLTEEEVMCIRYHMGAFTDKEEWRYYTRAVNQYTNVLWTHQADIIASHIHNT